MKTMEYYTCYCTREQTLLAFKLGAPIDNNSSIKTDTANIEIPTTQQMIGWLIEQNIALSADCTTTHLDWHIMVFDLTKNYVIMHINGENYQQVELAAIDAALNYLEKGK